MSLRIGLVYDLLGTHPARPGDPPDVDVEYEPERTLVLLEDALRRLGHEPVRLGSPHALLATAGKGDVPRLDAALNVAEGFGTRNREAWAPVLLEMLDVPALGPDALTLSLSLDKAWAKRAARVGGLPTPDWSVLDRAEAAHTAALPGDFPLFVKPRWEGTAKGIGLHSRVEGRAGLAAAVERIVAGYRQPALVEPFLPGAEYTVTVVGHGPPRALPVLQRALESGSGIGLHAVERHPGAAGGWSHALPGSLDATLEAQLAQAGLRAHELFECRDFSRSDFKLDSKGRAWFLEINPLPTFDPEASFGILAELAGRTPAELVAGILADGLRRLGLG